MQLDRLKQHWEALGREDPLWAVLTDPDRIGRRWDLPEFLATGVREVDELFAELAALGLVPDPGRALDFGCGVGRLTQALADRFARCDGVDIAASMIEEARRINRHGERVGYHVNSAADLTLFGDATFDFVVSFIVLQHMEPRYAKRYIAEFIRLLKPGGVAVFQVPTGGRPPDITPLPDAAFRAALAPAGDRPRSLRVLEETRVRVAVRNDSPCAWPVAAAVSLGGLWRDAGGRRLGEGDRRAPLDADLPPGATTTVELTVRAPSLPGWYRLELDLVQEQVSWFAPHGSPTLQLRVQVHPGDDAPAPRAAADGRNETLVPVIEMYSISPAEVRETVGASGGEIVHQTGDTRAGGTTESLRYIVRRGAEQTAPLPRASLSFLREAIAAVPDRPDLFPPVITRRSGRLGRLELRLRERLARILRPVTWVQADYDRRMLDALHEARAALEEQDAELRRLQEEVAWLRERGNEP